MTLETTCGTLLFIAAAGCIGTVLAAVVKKHSQRFIIAFGLLLLATMDFVAGAGLLNIIKVEYDVSEFAPGRVGLILTVISLVTVAKFWTKVSRNEEIPSDDD